MRRCLALLALAATTWSNVAVLRCTPALIPSSEIEAEVAVRHHGHASHGDGQHAAPASDDGPTSHPAGNDCGVVMACGTALGGQVAVDDRLLPVPFAEIASVALASPSAADLSQDPPPPRRHA
jgi:hypothetical protein